MRELEIVFQPGVEEGIHRGFFREAGDLFDVFLFEFFQIRFFQMLEHDAVPTMPFGKFQFAFAGDALLFDFSADLLVFELGS